MLSLFTDGLSDREIADHLYVSPRTIGSHVASILTKLDANSRAAATAIAIRKGIVRLESSEEAQLLADQPTMLAG